MCQMGLSDGVVNFVTGQSVFLVVCSPVLGAMCSCFLIIVRYVEQGLIKLASIFDWWLHRVLSLAVTYGIFD